MIPLMLIDRLEEDFFEAVTPILYAPTAFWLGWWVFWRVAQANVPHPA